MKYDFKEALSVVWWDELGVEVSCGVETAWLAGRFFVGDTPEFEACSSVAGGGEADGTCGGELPCSAGLSRFASGEDIPGGLALIWGEPLADDGLDRGVETRLAILEKKAGLEFEP